MNALEMLLQRIRASGAPDPRIASGEDWQAHLSEIEGETPRGFNPALLSDVEGEARPPDELLRPPGFGGADRLLHQNASGIYGGGERRIPAGDQVWGPGQVNDFVSSTTARVPQSEMRRWLNPNPGALPGLDGLLRISAGQSLARGLPYSRAAGPEDMGEPSLDPGWMAQINRRRLPPGLPLGVQDSILNQPSYSEGNVIPGPRNPLMEQEVAAGAFLGPQREAPLVEDIGVADYLKRYGEWPTPEGAMPWRPSGRSPFASPLNQLMQRPPFGLY